MINFQKNKNKFYHYNARRNNWTGTRVNVQKSFDNLFLDFKIKSELVSILDNFVNNKRKYEDSGIPHKLGFLLHGKPGNGKSSLAYAIAKTYDKNIYKINLTVDKNIVYESNHRNLARFSCCYRRYRYLHIVA